MSEIFILTPERKLVPLSPQPYASEDLLQTLLAEYPNLMAGDQMNPSTPRRWMLVKREVAVPGQENGSGRWSLDHLFLDQDGVPTLVEVKRSSDTRIRREVVGQMLDYAANGVKYWPIEALRASFEATCEVTKCDPDDKIRELIGDDSDPDEFWKTVKTNLQAGRIRMLFVADEIPDELRRIVEFLNEQMDPAEVLAIEIRQFVGDSVKTLVPRLIGQTIEAQDRKRIPTKREKRQWNEGDFFEALESRGIVGASGAARSLLNWGQQKTSRIWWGQGSVNGSFIPVLEIDKMKFLPFAVYTAPTGARPYVQMYFRYWAKRPPFDSKEKRLMMLERLNKIPGLSMSADLIDRWPSIPLSVLTNREAMTLFIEAMDWWVGEARKSASFSSPNVPSPTSELINDEAFADPAILKGNNSPVADSRIAT